MYVLGEYEANEAWLETGVSDCGRYAVLELPHTVEAVALAWREAIPQLMNYECNYIYNAVDE